MGSRGKFIWLTVFLLATITGCATESDLQRLRADMEGRIAASEDKQDKLIKQEITALHKEIGEVSALIVSLRKAEADTRADVTEMRDQIRRLRGSLEVIQKELSGVQGRVVDPKEVRELKEKIEQLSLRINFVENFLGIGKTEGGTKPTPGGAIKGKSEKEALYASAYENFRAGKYEQARQEFQNYLKAYPQSEYAANAQFWIAECYFNEKNYEQAVLEYEKVITGYPGSNKLPYALLKQGLSFLQLGDKTSARAIFQTIIKDYPNTNQASIARAKLLEMK
ncbi:MAG TPA: tol-pal system protein YbgF [Syntrophales bacterium]|nr:tol-pal system protein YbgF [Syntrophales bacterium]HOL58347.1 tol-pal system protein YbgF [Syntrophales bacterium]HPO34516.1 tol-pal system protein YbgF [Syntrophales bacterium]